MSASRCRFCNEPLSETFVDLGMSPLSNAFIPPDRATAVERFYPLHAYVCGECHLVQIAPFESPERIFNDYLYFSSYAESWLRHAETYACAMIARFGIGPRSQVIEIASNDGYLLQFFHRARIPVLGIEPAANVAAVAIEKGIPTDIAFFGRAARNRRLAPTRTRAWPRSQGNLSSICHKGHRRQMRDSRISHCGAPRGQDNRSLWRTRQGEYITELLRRPH
jgi:hypothetical protein